MYFEMAELDFKRAYKLLASTIVPRPIAWVVTDNESGTHNAAPFSFFNFFSGFPPVVCVGMTDRAGGPLDTLANIRRSGEFVINLVPDAMAQQMNVTAIDFPSGTSEVLEAGLKVLPSRQVKPPRIDGSPVAIECRLLQVMDVFNSLSHIVVAQVVGLHVVDEALVDAEKCYVDTTRLKLIGRMESPGWYVRLNERFEMNVPSVDTWSDRPDRLTG